MKQINLFTILMIAVLTSCGSKTKHIVAEIGKATLAGEEYTTYSVDNEYSISVPSFTEEHNNDPDRYSFIYNYTDFKSLDDIDFLGIFIEGDTREAYEAHRNKDKNLDKYPYTLKGYYDLGMQTGDKSHLIQLIGSPEETTINEMPALVQSYKSTIDLKVAKVSVQGYLVHIQASNGKIYRINIPYPPTEVEHEQDVPEWAIEVCNSFKIL